MLLQINTEHTDFNKHILPYTRNGIFIDTCIMKNFLDGFIDLRFSKKSNPAYDELISVLEHLKIHNKWEKFWITPHLFTEICQHFCQDFKRNKTSNFKKIVEEVIPILKEINEESKIDKDKILNLIDKDNPVIEMGDLSIFVAVDNILEDKNKIAIISEDWGVCSRYENYQKVMAIYYPQVINDLKLRK